MSDLKPLAEVVAHSGTLTVIRATHPQIEIDALEIGEPVYFRFQVEPLQARLAALKAEAEAEKFYKASTDKLIFVQQEKIDALEVEAEKLRKRVAELEHTLEQVRTA